MPEQAAPAKTGATVVVACKLPNGLILRLTKPEEHSEPVMGGGSKTVVQHRPTGEQVVVRGNAVAVGKTSRHRIVLPGGAEESEGAPFTDGYALTPGVPKDFWDKWLEQNRELDVVKNGLIFARESLGAAESKALDQIKTRSGLEPIDPAGDPRTPKRVTKGNRRDAA